MLPTALVALLALAASLPAEETGPILVQLADGTNLLLRSWSFSYEYAAWRKGEAPNLGSTARRDTRDLWVGKKSVPLAGQVLELEYAEEGRAVEGELRRVPVARGFALVSAESKRSKLKAEPPHSDLLAPEAQGRIVQARALDLRGETIAGTRREFCLLSYSSLVECPTEADQRVLRIQFRP